ncbi:hypothetical protein S2091_3486 [Solimicrobium silvestre]|uniref:Uncharacterized protein n=1 Tax=Solimicrobium silvestre TaxID=2099400 RepID=A0A2S9GVJ9_9BURK|nr:hypothetical protein S2091_3486 [Solimicrobium silvestre]
MNLLKSTGRIFLRRCWRQSITHAIPGKFRTLEMFKEWFEVEAAEWVLDLGVYPTREDGEE